MQRSRLQRPLLGRDSRACELVLSAAKIVGGVVNERLHLGACGLNLATRDMAVPANGLLSATPADVLEGSRPSNRPAVGAHAEVSIVEGRIEIVGHEEGSDTFGQAHSRDIRRYVSDGTSRITEPEDRTGRDHAAGHNFGLLLITKLPQDTKHGRTGIAHQLHNTGLGNGQWT
jgi:hypothetical protein